MTAAFAGTANPDTTEHPRVSAIVLTQDEAAHILPCLRTLRWADERLVVDSGSTDDTVDLARAAGARVLRHEWHGWAVQRNYAAAQAAHDWVFFVDADERVPLELADEIRSALATHAADTTDAAGAPAGYWVPRQNLIMGRWVKQAGWWPDRQLRLYRRDRGGYDLARPVHELVVLDGPTAPLRQRLIHHNYVSWRQFWTKQRRYARAEAGALAARSIRAKPQNFVLQPWREFRRRYWTLEGYRAGPLGLGLSLVLAAANLVMYVELWRRGRRDRDARKGTTASRQR
jgi:glycosyltransferase involved in cell wall biosynthesis